MLLELLVALIDMLVLLLKMYFFGTIILGTIFIIILLVLKFKDRRKRVNYD